MKKHCPRRKATFTGYVLKSISIFGNILRFPSYQIKYPTGKLMVVIEIWSLNLAINPFLHMSFQVQKISASLLSGRG